MQRVTGWKSFVHTSMKAEVVFGLKGAMLSSI
jgi:hypothetical protein